MPENGSWRYLLAGENLSYMEFFSKVGRVTGKKTIKLQIPEPLLKFLGRMIGWFKPGASLNALNAQILCTGNYYSAEKALMELGLPQTPIEHGIAQALAWFGRTD